MTKTFHLFRKIAIAEGISFLLLLGIAMPLKYFAGLPVAVTIAGALHGILFIAFLVLAWDSKNEPLVLAWKRNGVWMILCFFAAILPFGTFVLDKKLQKQQDGR